MSRPTTVASGATDVQGYTGSGCLVGIAFRADAASATAVLYDNTSAAGTILAVVGEPTSGVTTYMPVPAVNFTNGIFVDRTNASTLVLYLL